MKQLKDRRIQEKYTDELGQDIEVDFEVEKKRREYKTRNRYPCGTLEENWNKKTQDWEP